MIFNFDISIPVAGLLVCCFVTALTAAMAGLRPMRKVARVGRRATSPERIEDEVLPSLSVIVYAKNAEEHIESFLTELLRQDYTEYEVIVVNDASIDNTSEIVENMMEKHGCLRYTFVPDSSINVSRRKAAYTLGMKAAKNEVVLMTASNVTIPSDRWLRIMAGKFTNPSTEVCLGISRVPQDTDNGAGRFWRAFDNQVTATQWLGTALAGKPYRGDGFNLALRKDTFFNNNGFASTNRFQAGEDDICVNEIATTENTAIVMDKDAVPEVILDSEQYARLWLRAKERYTFTSRYLHTAALRMQGLHSLCLWLSLGCAIYAAISGLPNLLPALTAMLIMIILWGYQICVYRRASAALASRRLLLSAPLFWLMRPLINGIYRMRFKANKSSNYTWSK